MLLLRDIWKSYGVREVLRGISLEAEGGRISCIIGPNGSGKTTILRVADLLEAPDSGAIAFDGNDVLSLGPEERIGYRRRMAMVFQQPALYDMSVFDNVAMGLRIRGMDKGVAGKRAEEALKAVNLYDLRAARAHSLSGGEAQRLCLAGAMAVEPEGLLLDEPTANLDPANTIIVEEIIRRYAKEKGGIVIFTTHNMFEAKRLADRVLFLMEGRAIEEGEAAEVLNNPKGEMTARFLKGEMVLG